MSDGLRGALEAEGTGMKSQETHEGVMDSGKCKLVGWKVVCVFMRVSRNVAGKINRGWIQKSLYDLLNKCQLAISFSMETRKDSIFLGSKISADGDCSHEIKRRLLLGRKAMTNLDSILKSRHITLLTKVCLAKQTKVCLSRLWFFQ